MPGLLAFHAHPDDEATSTGGVLARYSDAGEHVVVVTATDGAEGEVHNYDNPEEIRTRLAPIRAEEMAASAAILGISQHHFLGYRDSGMMGSEPNQHPDCSWQADFNEATARLIRLIRLHQPEVMTIYDPFGGYGHPDHIQVHRVGLAAFFASSDTRRFPLEEGETLWNPLKLYMSTWPRSRVEAMIQGRLRAGLITEEEAKESEGWGTPDDDITTLVDHGGGRYSAPNALTGGWSRNLKPYSPIELYLAGLLPPEEVPDLWVAADGKFIERAGGRDVFTASQVRTFTIEDIIAEHGARVPDHTQSQKAFRTAVILLVSEDYPAIRQSLDTLSNDATLFSHAGEDQFDNWYNFYEATGGRATIAMDGLSQFKSTAAVKRPTVRSFGTPPPPIHSLCECKH